MYADHIMKIFYHDSILSDFVKHEASYEIFKDLTKEVGLMRPPIEIWQTMFTAEIDRLIRYDVF